VDQRKNNIDTLSREFSEHLKPKLEGLLFNLASASGWPSDVTDSIKINIDSDLNLSLDYPPEIKNKIEDLEYGAVGEIPNAVIRPFLLRAPRVIEQTIQEKALSKLFDSVVTF
jgi:hypothetical protein